MVCLRLFHGSSSFCFDQRLNESSRSVHLHRVLSFFSFFLSSSFLNKYYWELHNIFHKYPTITSSYHLSKAWDLGLSLGLTDADGKNLGEPEGNLLGKTDGIVLGTSSDGLNDGLLL